MRRRFQLSMPPMSGPLSAVLACTESDTGAIRIRRVGTDISGIWVQGIIAVLTIISVPTFQISATSSK